MTLFADRRGAAAVEFALVAPVFLMMIFLMFDGGRMIFTKQALQQVAIAAARCRALGATGCDTNANAETWAVTRARRTGGGQLAAATASVTDGATCNAQSGMAKATLSLDYKRGAMNLLPQALTPSTLTASYCFPIATT